MTNRYPLMDDLLAISELDARRGDTSRIGPGKVLYVNRAQKNYAIWAIVTLSVCALMMLGCCSGLWSCIYWS